MLRVEEAREVILRHAPPRRVERVPLDRALGLILAGDLAAKESLPPFRRSGMDGYALRSADTAAATRENPVILPLTGVIPAGHPLAEPLPPGQCASIMTGGAVPAGADAVIRLEEVRVTPAGVTIFRHVPENENIAPIGEDVQEGQVVLRAGHRIRAAEINLLTAIGIGEVPVYAPPRVGILCTGDELVPLGAAPGPGQIRNSNGPCLAALVRSVGCIPVDLGTALDVTDVIAGALGNVTGCDLIVTTGGVSVGDFDVVREALTVLGAEQLFWRISLKPGTPVCAAVLEGRLVIGLSGNPAAAITNFDLLVRPLLDSLCGRARIGLREAEGVLDQPVLKTAGIARYLRARVYSGPGGEIRIDTGMAQRAGILSSMMYANAYAIVPAHEGPLPVGARLQILLQDDADVTVPSK
ncbi:MAG TPA: gephyrin-like molybdotransferase Glp [Symbiobacteriaceae bacterium]|nr:gephyrin-like molybdotransferase Glp [Symbiobacteriaceae bacterium]